MIPHWEPVYRLVCAIRRRYWVTGMIVVIDSVVIGEQSENRELGRAGVDPENPFGPRQCLIFLRGDERLVLHRRQSQSIRYQRMIGLIVKLDGNGQVRTGRVRERESR